MDYLTLIFISGFAVCYIVELCVTLLRFNSLFKNLANIALTAGFMWFTAPHTIIGIAMVAAAAFITTALQITIVAVTSKPQVINRRY